MQLKLTVGIIKKFLKKHPNEALEDAIKWDSDDRESQQDIDQFSENELVTLARLCDTAGMTANAKKIVTFQNIKQNPGGRVIKRLEDLQAALKHYLSKSPNYWLYYEFRGVLLPFYIRDIKYFPYEPDNPAHVSIYLTAISRGETVSGSETWHTDDIRGGLTASELLTKAKMFWPTKELLEGYDRTMARYKLLHPQTGEQFVAEGDGEIYESRWSSGRISMVRDGVPAKLVMDDNPPKVGEENEGCPYGDDDGLEADGFWRLAEKEETGKVAIPVHPFVQLFDLEQHNFVIVSSDQLVEYKWNPKLGDKLILPEAHKEVVTILMNTASEEIDDIIAGKSGGTIVVCTGEPGTGKTLTAEVTSEVVKRPLYKVQCSQLGTDEEAIETELTLVLNRASRWKALLLIDEADVYVRARENDIQQNAIVGVFLRVLEYYRGILFMTSNRATVIDDAIMSRATVHLKYSKPSAEELCQIWHVLATQFGLDFGGDFIHKLVKTFPHVVGRDIKNLLKLAIRYNRHKGGKITLELFKLLAVHKDILTE